MPGRLLFALLMGVFFVVLIGWTVTTPVEPGRPSSDSARVEPGNIVVVEFTQWYGEATGPGFVSASTQEERYEADGLPIGAVPPQLRTEPETLRIPPDAGSSLDPTLRSLLGRVAGDSFTTERVPPDMAAGQWEEGRTFDRALVQYPIEEVFGGPDVPWSLFGVSNLSAYEAAWVRQGVGPFEPGAEFPCDGTEKWECVVEDRSDEGNGTLTIRRAVSEGERYDLEPFLRFGASVPGYEGDVVVRIGADGGSFRLLLAPEEGTVFQVRGTATGSLARGTYRVVFVADDTFVADYAESELVRPSLIGKYFWYDFEIVRVGPPSP